MLLLILSLPIIIVTADAIVRARFQARVWRREAMWRAIERGLVRGEDPRELVRRHYVPF